MTAHYSTTDLLILMAAGTIMLAVVGRALIIAREDQERSLHFHWRDAAIRGEWFGCGYEHVIIASAEETSKRQVAAHRAGDDLGYVQDVTTFETALFGWANPKWRTES